jgi:hypothetical protein
MSFDNKKHWIATGRNDKSQISHHIKEEQSDVEIDLTPQRQKLIGQRLGRSNHSVGIFQSLCQNDLPSHHGEDHYLGISLELELRGRVYKIASNPSNLMIISQEKNSRRTFKRTYHHCTVQTLMLAFEHAKWWAIRFNIDDMSFPCQREESCVRGKED